MGELNMRFRELSPRKVLKLSVNGMAIIKSLLWPVEFVETIITKFPNPCWRRILGAFAHIAENTGKADIQKCQYSYRRCFDHVFSKSYEITGARTAGIYPGGDTASGKNFLRLNP